MEIDDPESVLEAGGVLELHAPDRLFQKYVAPGQISAQQLD